MAAAAISAAFASVAAFPAPAAGARTTVLTLEGGIVGAQHLLHFTPLQLGGRMCAGPNRCRPVDYPALPGESFNRQGADLLAEAVGAVDADDGSVVMFGHSQGGQVIHDVLRRWAADPGLAPEPSRVSWVSIGNPENPFGGAAPRADFPIDTPYAGTEVIRQYDGWADWPSDRRNLLAVLNAAMGSQRIHPNYFDVALDDPANVRFTPPASDGAPGQVTYVWVPTPVLPLVAGAGPFAPVLDSILRPIVEAGYDRPVDLPVSQRPSGGGTDPAPRPRPLRRPVPAPAVPNTIGVGSNRGKAPAAAGTRPATRERSGAERGGSESG